MKTKPINVVDYMIQYEEGTLDREKVVELFQRLVDSGQAWTLQGHYGRTARMLIDAGYVIEKGKK